MSDSLYRLVYVSAARELLSKTALMALLTQSRARNEKLGVTGILLYREGDFLQVLEGPRTTVKALYNTITRDPRHTGTILMHEGDADARLFANWSMGFRELSDPHVRATAGFSEFMNPASEGGMFSDDQRGCIGLLKMFKREA